jgi:hypothetical protein
MNRKTLGILATTALVFLASAASAEITFDQNSAEEYCKNDWTKRGVLDKNMYSYCMDGQTDGFELAKERYLKYKLENHVELIDERSISSIWLQLKLRGRQRHFLICSTTLALAL